ncbi:hypothetical protein MNBD_BACTEROID07-1404, partial [hydrothermal vent metagenome]
TKSGGKQAVVATARKLASIYYKTVTEKIDFNPNVLRQNSEVYIRNKLKSINKLKNRLEKALTYCEGVTV